MSDSPIRVFQVLEAWRHGGTEHYVRQVGETLARLDPSIRQHVVTLRPGGGDLGSVAGWASGVHELADGTADPLAELGTLIERERPDVVHLHLYASMGRVLTALRRANIPRLGATFHFGLDRWRWHRRGGWKRAARTADFATATSRRSAESFGRLSPRIEVVYPTLPSGLVNQPLDSDVTADTDPANGQAREPRPLRVLGCGRLTAEKDWPTLLRAIHAASGGLDIHCGLAGDGVLAGELRETVKRLAIEDRVCFYGNLPQAELRRVMSEADVMVVPSRFEGFGMAAAEAMAIGVPTILSDQVAAGELLESPQGESSLGESFKGGSSQAESVRDAWVRLAGHDVVDWPLSFPVGDWRTLCERLQWHARYRSESRQLAREIAPLVRAALTPEKTVGKYALLYRGASAR